MKDVEKSELRIVVYDCLLEIFSKMDMFEQFHNMEHWGRYGFSEEEEVKYEAGRKRKDSVRKLSSQLDSAVRQRIEAAREIESQVDAIVREQAAEYVKSEEFLDGVAERFKKKQL